MASPALAVSCFDGTDALGLPCNTDDDCGQGQRCEQGFCGGPPATGSGSGSGSDSGSSSSSSSSSGVDSSGSETGVVGCGDGEVDAALGEECDPGPAGETETCNADCTLADCGDEVVNLAAGEECDDGNDSNLDECTTSCRNVLFWDDLEEDPVRSGDWETDEPLHESEDDGAPDFMLTSGGWQWGVPQPGVWHSGIYSSESGTARLLTREIEVPDGPGEGFQYELRFRHRLRFDGNDMDNVGTPCEGAEAMIGDGGVVMVIDGPGPPRPVGPPMGHPDMLDDDGLCIENPTDPANPLYDEMMPRPVYTGISPPDLVDVQLVLPDVDGETIQLLFEVGYDCANCWQDDAPMGAGWTIDDVVVAAFPMGGGG